MNWKLENYSMGESIIIENASFKQIISNPDGTKGNPVPLDDDYIEIVAESEEIKIPLDEIDRFEKIGKGENNEFLFKTNNGEYTGTLKQGLSEIVMAGITKEFSVDILLTDIDLAERISQEEF